MTYSDYLTTQHWQRCRKVALEAYGGRCAMCQSHAYLNVHHVRYKRNGKSILFNEQPEDLIVLCKSCHELWHRAERMDRQRLQSVTQKMANGNHLDWRAKTSRYVREPSIKIPSLPSTRYMHRWTAEKRAAFKQLKKARLAAFYAARGGK